MCVQRGAGAAATAAGFKRSGCGSHKGPEVPRPGALFGVMALDVKAPYGPFKYYVFGLPGTTRGLRPLAPCSWMATTPGRATPSLVDSMMMSWGRARYQNHTRWGALAVAVGPNRYAANSAGIAVLAARATQRRLKFSTSTPHHSCTTCGR
jgi:hypothetical protein